MTGFGQSGVAEMVILALMVPNHTKYRYHVVKNNLKEMSRDVSKLLESLSTGYGKISTMMLMVIS